ncbi:MAG: diguanylate cyclase [Isosphaeraceae bacterium]|nr:diguanylate cyclase [Isosphaeraceae bacterium]
MIPNGTIEPERRVLLIQTSASERRVLRRWLEAEALEVFEAADAAAGLAACAEVRPSLVLLEFGERTPEGFAALRRLKEGPYTRSIPVIGLSADANSAEKARCIDLGAVDVLSPPFEPVEFLARIGSALRTKALLDLLESRAHLDGLTGLGNRFALEDQLRHDWEVCRRRGCPLAVLLADLDRFKAINDRYGHAAGDEVLRQATAALRRSARAGDFLARYGGEELVVVAPDCDLDGALLLAERLRASVAGLRVAYRDLAIRLTVSIGVAAATDLDQDGPLDLLLQADQALYRAKAAGRDTVCAWGPIDAASIATGAA